MKKKLLVLILFIVCTIGLVGCGLFGKTPDEPTTTHTHSYSKEWKYNEKQHWIECENDGCDAKKIRVGDHTDKDEDGKCDVCDYTLKDVHKHDLVLVPANSATCTENGNVAYYACVSCEKWFADEKGATEITDKTSVVVHSVGHKLVEVSKVDPTCTKNGNIEYYICENCEKYYFDENGASEITNTSDIVIPALNHKLTMISHNDATCTENGNEAYYTCENCGKWFEDENATLEITDKTSLVINATGHKITEVERVEATCTKEGNKAYYVCENGCGKWFGDESATVEIIHKETVVLPAIGHNPILVEHKDATCTEEGNIAYYVCGNNCGKWFVDENATTEIEDKTSVVIPAIGHNSLLIEHVDSTCTEAGNTAYYICYNCNKWFEDEDSNVEITDKEQVVILAIGHKTTLIAHIDATCTEEGKTAYYICNNCNKWFEDEDSNVEITDKEQVAIPAIGHKTALVKNKDATCTEDGNTAYYICENGCGKWFEDENAQFEIVDHESVVINAKGHSVFEVAYKEATCTEDGNIAYYVCEDCSLWFTDDTATVEIVNKDSVVIPKGHNYGDWISEIPATCEADGTKGHYNCSACGKDFDESKEELYSLVIEKLGHDLALVDKVSESCTTDGSIAYYSCNNGCGKLFSIEDETLEIKAEDIVISKHHTLIYVAAVEETCTEDGNISYYVCEKCGLYFNDENGESEIVNQSSIVILHGHNFEGGYCTRCNKPTPTEGLTYSFNTFYYTVTGLGTATTTDIVIPDEYNGKAVCAISSSAFKNTDITSIIIGDNVTSIIANSFSGCERLNSVDLGNKVRSIGSYAFNGCTSLTNITIPDSVTDIIDGAFYGCTSLLNIKIGANVEKIGRASFKNCISLEEIVLPSKVTTISQEMFYECSGLKKVTFEGNVTSIAEKAFYNCSGLSEFTIPEGVTAIGELAFHATGLSEITIPASVNSIEGQVFLGCESLTKVIINPGVTSIGRNAFENCISLTDITIPNSVTSIGSGAFNGCVNLTSLVANGLTNIEINALTGCTALETLTVPSVFTVPNSNVKTSYLGALFGATYDNSNGRKDYETHNEKVPESLKTVIVVGASVEPYALYGCRNITTIAIEGVEVVNAYAFARCDSITSISYGKDLRIICDSAFSFSRTNKTLDIIFNGTLEDYLSLKLIENDDYGSLLKLMAGISKLTSTTSLDSISENRIHFNGEVSDELLELEIEGSVYVSKFFGCQNIKSVKIHNGSVVDCAFFGCKNLDRLEFNVDSIDNKFYIGNYAFKWCYELTSVEIPEGCTQIGKSAFFACKKLESVTLPDSIISDPTYTVGTGILDSAFAYTALVSVTIPNGITVINDNTFKNCDKLVSVSLADNITSIGLSAFSGCTSLERVTIPDSVTYIYGSAFMNCSGMKDLVIGSGILCINLRAFYGCSSLETITLPHLDITNASADKNYRLGQLFNSANSYDYDVSKLNEKIPTTLTTVIVLGGNSVPDYYFQNCSNLTSILLPETIETIGAYAFDGCSSLDGIEIPESVTSIGEYAFRGCERIETIIIGDNVETIGSWAFSGCSKLSDITVGDKITEFGSAFSGCSTSLVSLKLGNGITTIGDRAFQNYALLETLVLGNGLTSIGTYAFGGCTALTSVTIPDSVITIGESAFNGCTALTSITVNGKVDESGKTLTTIKAYAFSGCTALASVTIGNGVANIENGILYGCNKLASLSVPFVGGSTTSRYTFLGYFFNGVSTSDTYSKNPTWVPRSLKTVTVTGATALANYAFYECESLQDVILNVSSVGSYAFGRCINLKNITINGNVNADGTGTVSIGANSFNGCTALTNATLGNGVKLIGQSAFLGCTKLSKLVVEKTVTSCSSNALTNCTALEYVFFGGDSTSWGKLAVSSNVSADVLYYFSENEPELNEDGTAYSGNYWHYDENGEPVVWQL